MMKFAKIVSFLLGPSFVLFPVPYILISKLSNDYAHALRWTIFSYLFILFTAFFVFLGVLLKVFSNFNVSKREQRPLLFALLAFAMFCYLISLLIFNAPKILFFYIFSLIVGLLIIVIVNKWVKASIHMAILTSVISLTAFAYEGHFALLLLLIPLLAWSRIKMKEHTLVETIIGSFLGISLTLIAYVIGKYFIFDIISN